MNRVFLLSPAYAGGERARMISNERAHRQNCFASHGDIGVF